MKANEFLNELSGLGWTINQNTQSDNYDLSEFSGGRFTNAPYDLKEFILMIVSCANKEDTIWFLSTNDYLGQSDSAFAWNEFEMQSLEVAEENEIAAIKNFWTSHLPFLLSVKNGYAYVAVVLDGVNKGKVVIGNEPIYEEVSVVAANLPDFFDVFISFLKGGNNLSSLNILK